MAENAKKRGGGRKATAPLETSTITFDYVKSNHFRLIRLDGVLGAVDPGGETIHMAVWTQRLHYPQRAVHTLNPGGKLGERTAVTTVEGDIVREIEAGLAFTPETAKQLIRWLQNRLAELGLGIKPNPSESASEEVME